jgi:hypothetical protein
MNDDTPNNPDETPQHPPQPPSHFGPQSQEIRHSQVSALVPEHVARGVFSTGAVVLQGAHEFIIDFLLRMTNPHRVAARVVLPPPVVPRLIGALRENLGNYQKRFGPPHMPPITAGAGGNQPVSPQELYEQLRIPDDQMSGVYANAVMIGHTATEFSFDFITTFFPRSAVASRVYLAAPNVPRFLESLAHSYEQYEKRLRNPPPTAPPPPPESQDPPA